MRVAIGDFIDRDGFLEQPAGREGLDLEAVVVATPARFFRIELHAAIAVVIKARIDRGVDQDGALIGLSRQILHALGEAFVIERTGHGLDREDHLGQRC